MKKLEIAVIVINLLIWLNICFLQLLVQRYGVMEEEANLLAVKTPLLFVETLYHGIVCPCNGF